MDTNFNDPATGELPTEQLKTNIKENQEKEKSIAALIIANKELAFQNEEKKKRATELIIANKELAFQNEEKEKRAAELIIAKKELDFQNEEKDKRAAELIIANKELAFQNEEKDKRAAELIIADKELDFQNEEKDKRAAELKIADKELAFQNEEKEKRAAELIIANKELAFQNEEKDKRAAELIIANKELAFQNEEKEKRAAELIIANKELAFQNQEKEKRAAELIIANKELAFQSQEKEKRASELIIASQSNLQLILDSVAEAIYGIDNDGNCTFCNISGLKMLGYKHQDELIGKNMHCQIHYQHEDKTPFLVEDCRIFKAFLAGERSQVNDEVLWRKDGKCFPVEYFSFPQYIDGVVVGAVVTFIDITDRKEVETSLREAKIAAEGSNLMKSRFLANMSHEIRTPMNGILGFLNLLQRTELSLEQKNYISEANLASEMLLYLINDILDFSKIEAGKLDIENINFNIRTAVEDAVSVIVPKAFEKQIELHTMIRSNVPEEVIGDPGRIKQILNNLISNAVKFTEKGEISVTLDCEKDIDGKALLSFEVKDTGIGINKHNLSKLFTPFTQENDSTTRKFGGTGLGLAISKELVKLMNGSISVESEAGTGSIFRFTVLLEISKQLRDSNIFEKLNGINVLIVDDNENSRKVIRSYLEDVGCRVFEADGAEKAITSILMNSHNENRINLAIIDFQMPGMNGYQLATTIKTIPFAKDIKLILMTSVAQKSDSLEVNSKGFEGYIAKPVRRDELINSSSLVLGLKEEKETEENSLIKSYTGKKTINEIKPKILLVEDNRINRKIIIETLKHENMTCDIAVDGREALKAVNEKDYDMVFMDCQMPIMDGYESTAQIRKMEGDKKHTIIIAMTANAMNGDRLRCIEAGMDEYISKPINFDIMFSMIAANTKQKESKKVCSDFIDNNIDKFLNATGLNRDDAIKIFEEYLKERPNLLKGISDAILNNDFGELKELIHQLKGTSGSLRVTSIYELSIKLEEAAMKQEINECKRLFMDIKNFFN